MCSDAAIQISHVTSSSPSTLAKPEPGARAAARARARPAARPAGPPPRSAGRARAQRASRPGRVPWSPMSLYDLVAVAAPARSRATRSKRLARTVSSGFERKSTIIVAAGRRRRGPRRGRDLRGRGPRRPAGGRAGARRWRASARSTRFSEHLGDARHSSRATRPSRTVYRRYRRWGFESAALDLALRQADTSLHELLGRTAEPVTFVVSSRMGEPPTIAPVTRRLARLPGAALQARRDAGLDRRADRGAAGDRRGRLDRLQGRLQGHASSTSRPTRRSTSTIAEAFPDAWLEDPDLETDEARNALAPHQDRITWDAPIHSRRGHPRRAGDAAHGQPQAVALRLA